MHLAAVDVPQVDATVNLDNVMNVRINHCTGICVNYHAVTIVSKTSASGMANAYWVVQPIN